MNSTGNPRGAGAKRTRYLPAWLAFPLALVAWWGIPWALSSVARRYGWVKGRPGIWNLLGLVLVLPGTAGLLRGVAEHSAQSPRGVEWEQDKSYLLRGGMYAYSRNPMYLSELVLMFGWVIFYGSAAVLAGWVAWYLFFSYLVPREERLLEAHFGDSYREYKRRVPRWLGKIER